jgi:probable addiction module antidote protein
MKATLRHNDFMRKRLADAHFAAGCLQSALEDADLRALLLALRRIAEARGGMTKLAQATGLTREALYRTLSAAGNPRLSSLAAILGATGLRLTIIPAEGQRRRRRRAASAPRHRRLAATA